MNPPICATTGCWRSAMPGTPLCGGCRAKARREEERARARAAAEAQLGLPL